LITIAETLRAAFSLPPIAISLRVQRHLPLATALTQLQAEDAVWLSQIKKNTRKGPRHKKCTPR